MNKTRIPGSSQHERPSLGIKALPERQVAEFCTSNASIAPFASMALLPKR
ncbi:MAG: hypothetical protein P1U77_00475 [Rubripirellula sp.]|nr:hypothetical protein [Rubripirellula sp.]